MLVIEYDDFVRQTDQYKGQSAQNRHAIALYGIAGEIGSLLAAIKKKLLAEDGKQGWNKANEEIILELGDVIWYTFSMAQIINKSAYADILSSNIAALKIEIGSDTDKAKKIRRALAALDTSKNDRFLTEAKRFPKSQRLKFDDYQKLAFTTARTSGRVLLDVCLAVLWQLGAELLRMQLPSVELGINKSIASRDVNEVLGEIMWHVSAISRIYKLSLDEVVAKNVEKVNFRSDRSHKTPLHDRNAHLAERFPRKFEVCFVSVGPNQTRMYMNSRQLGDPLTDNSYEDDGYRFHDVMHLSNIAHLSWSPVMRKLMNIKRKRSAGKLEEVEDGARALLVEEVVVKAIHSDGKRLAQETASAKPGEPERQFPTRSAIPFRLLKSLQEHVSGLEVKKNQFWEWEDAIFDGARVFHALRMEKQGTVTVNMQERSLTFSPDVFLRLKGIAIGIGTGSVPHDPKGQSRTSAAKLAILAALGISTPTARLLSQLNLKFLDKKTVAVKAIGEVQKTMWQLRAIDFQLAFLELPEVLCCTAIAIGDVKT